MLTMNSNTGWVDKALQTLLAACLLLVCWGCGGSGSSSTSTTTGVTANSSATQVRMGDAPADRVLVFEVTAGPITLTPSQGAAVTVLSMPRRLELMHNSGTTEPLSLTNIPQGTYTSASMTVANPEVVFTNSAGQIVKLEPAFNQAITVTFSPALTISASAAVVSIDLNVANSLTFDPSGNVTGVNLSASSFTFSSSTVAAENEQEPDNGEMEDTTGTVSSVSGNSFTLSLGTGGTSLTFATDSNTEFKDGATLATLTNMVVSVEGVTRADGTLYAKEVEGVEAEGGAEVEGVISSVTGNPASQLGVVVDAGSGSGVDDSKTGSTVTANVSGAGYKVSKGNLDLSGIGGLPATPNFPFDAATIHAGQRVEVESESGAAATTVQADKVKLVQQTLAGTISEVSGSAPTVFTVTVPADSVFATLSGSTTVSVFWQPGTDVRGLPHAPANGDSVRVRGLLFFTGSGFNMIARRITQ